MVTYPGEAKARGDLIQGAMNMARGFTDVPIVILDTKTSNAIHKRYRNEFIAKYVFPTVTGLALIATALYFYFQ